MQKRHTGGLKVTNLTSKNKRYTAQSFCHLYRALLATISNMWTNLSVASLFTLIFFSVFALVLCASNIRQSQHVGLLQHVHTATTIVDSQNTNNSARKTQQSSYANAHSKGIELSIIKATPVVTDTSGYNLTVTLKSTAKTLPAGTIQASINANYTFVSRTDVQNWSQEESFIPTPQVLDSLSTTEIKPDSTATFRFNIPADKPELQAIWHWGPKPLKITYFSQDSSQYASIHSFLTRSNAGMRAADSPAMKLTAVMPMLANTQYSLKSDITQSSHQTSTLLQADNHDTHHILEQADLVSKHAKLQTIADISTLQAARLLFRPNAYMQQSGFDISAYADDNSDTMYRSAGIAKTIWSSKNSQIPHNTNLAQSVQTSHTIQTSTTSNKSASKQTTASSYKPSQSYAWQTQGKWTLSALEQAKRNGYNTVIATDEFNNVASQFAVTHGVYDIDTPAGSVRVLASQQLLTTLANGKPTSTKATGEQTEAGRINRLVAQSAFYQMEQPYVDRHILITFSPSTPVSNVDAVMNALEQSSWLSLSDLSSMSKLKNNTLNYWEHKNIVNTMPKNSGIEPKMTRLRRSTLSNLSRYKHDVLRFTHHILDYTASQQVHDTEGDAQALAKQTAKTKNTVNPTVWQEYLLQLYENIALHDLINNTSAVQQESKRTTTDTATTMKHKSLSKSALEKNAAQRFANTLLNGIRIVPPRDITAVSETASMPITISNTYPYPVQVYLSADTHAMEIVARRKTLVKIPANSETQVTLPLRITTSIRTKATFVLEDTKHHAFSKQYHTFITSTLQISDKSGTIIIIFAFMIGLLGLWRQFHRKKDPDE